MTTSMSPSAALAVIEPAFSEPETLALAGFLAGYSGMTREAYALDLRQFSAWCRQRQLRLFAVRRADIELFARDLEAAGRARATITRRLSTIAGLYKYAVEEDLLDHSPAVHVRRPRIDYESHATGLDRNEVGALLVAAGLGSAAEHALISLLALNGLRVSEATGADIEALGTERGHRTLAITRKGGKKAVIPLAPRTARAIDLTIGERCEGPISDSGKSRERRELKHRAPGETRLVPVHPELVMLFRDHLERFGTGPGRQIFTGPRGGIVAEWSYLEVFRAARRDALGEIDAATPLMGRPYDLRHAAVSTWLNAGVPAAQVAEWAGHSVDVLLRVYAKCIAGQQDAAKQRIEDAMRDQPGDAIADDDGLGPDDLGTGR